MVEVQHDMHESWTGLPFPTPGTLPHPGVGIHVSCIIYRRTLYHCTTWVVHL